MASLRLRNLHEGSSIFSVPLLLPLPPWHLALAPWGLGLGLGLEVWLPAAAAAAACLLLLASCTWLLAGAFCFLYSFVFSLLSLI